MIMRTHRKFLGSLCLAVMAFTMISGLSSCSGERRIEQQSDLNRDYERDARLMSQFVDVDRSSGQLYINDEKRLNPSDYVVNQSREELGRVSSLNRDRFMREMGAVNDLLKSLIDGGGVDYVAYNLADGKSLILDFSDDRGLRMEARIPTPGYTRGYAHIDVEPKRRAEARFAAGNEFILDMNINCQGDFYAVGLDFADNADGVVEKSMVMVGVNTHLSYSYIISDADMRGDNVWKVIGSSFLDRPGAMDVISFDVVE